MIIANEHIADSGDSIILNSAFETSTNAAIVFLSSGGLRIIGCKVNVATIGVQVVLGDGVATSGPYISCCSIENTSIAGFRFQRATAVGSLSAPVITGCEVHARQFLDIVADSPWIRGLTVTGNVLASNSATSNVFAVVNAVTGWSISNNTFTKNPPGTTQVFLIGSTATFGIAGPIAVDGVPEIASINAGANNTLFLPF